MRRAVVVILAVLAGVFAVPSIADAKAARTAYSGIVVEYVENLDSSWDVRRAVEDIDYWTGSDLRVVSRCSGKWKCISIRKGRVSGWKTGPVAWAHACSSLKCYITVDTDKARRVGQFGYYTKRWLLRHEVGHTRYLPHRETCDSTMYEYRRCRWGSVPPNKFTSAERATLRRY